MAHRQLLDTTTSPDTLVGVRACCQGLACERHLWASPRGVRAEAGYVPRNPCPLPSGLTPDPGAARSSANPCGFTSSGRDKLTSPCSVTCGWSSLTQN